MNRVNWDLEEVVALVQFYFLHNGGRSFPQDAVCKLSDQYRKRAQESNFETDDKYRNTYGLNMQLACLHYVISGGTRGLSNANKLFYSTVQLYQREPDRFQEILNSFEVKYGPIV